MSLLQFTCFPEGFQNHIKTILSYSFNKQPILMETIGNKGKAAAVGCPGVYIYAALAAKQFRQHPVIPTTTTAGHHSQFHLLIRGMVTRRYIPFAVSDIYHHGAVRRNMREPTVRLVKGHLSGVCSVHRHPPKLHQSGAGGVKPDIAATWGELRAVI